MSSGIMLQGYSTSIKGALLSDCQVENMMKHALAALGFLAICWPAANVPL
jgi:ABC-type uncharacterized transport system permease subunit